MDEQAPHSVVLIQHTIRIRHDGPDLMLSHSDHGTMGVEERHVAHVLRAMFAGHRVKIQPELVTTTEFSEWASPACPCPRSPQTADRIR